MTVLFRLPSVLCLLCWALISSSPLVAEDGTVNRLTELTFTSAKAYADPFNEVKLFERYDWKTFRPHAEWAAYAGDAAAKKPAYGPYATGSDKTRLIYVPERHVVAVAGLAADARYVARVFNPVLGTTTDVGSVTADVKGTWTAKAPEHVDADDWVLIIECQ